MIYKLAIQPNLRFTADSFFYAYHDSDNTTSYYNPQLAVCYTIQNKATLPTKVPLISSNAVSPVDAP